jgi:hypothetical protein
MQGDLFAQHKKEKTIIFTEGSELDGKRPDPEWEDVPVRQKLPRANLIRIRIDFIRETLKSAENL